MSTAQTNGLKECRIEYENNDTRNTAIGYFIDMAIDDDDATVFVAETDEKVTEMEDVPEIDQ